MIRNEDGRMKQKLIQFMQGRYGVDSFSKFLLVVGLIVVFASALINGRLSNVVYILGWAAVIYSYFRMFSKNVSKRYAENQAFSKKTYGVRAFFKNQKNMMLQRKSHHIYTCPSCRQKIRVPKGKGKIEVRCPKCSTTFVKRS